MLTPLGWGHDVGFESSFIHDKSTLQNGGWDFKARQFVDYLRFRLVRGYLSDNFFKILGPFAYDYVVLPYYTVNQTRTFFLNQKGGHVVYNQSSIILQNDYATSRIFAANQSMFVVGGFESFDALSKIESFNLNKTTLYYAPESIDDSALLYERINASQMFCLANSDIFDLAMISLGEKAVMIHAGDYGFSSLNMTKYWVKWPSWRIIGAFVLGGEILTTVGKNKIDIPFDINSDGFYNVFLRIGFAPSRGKLSLSIDNELASEFSPYYPLMSKLEWVNITCQNLAKGRHIVTLENDGTGFNDVDAVAVFKSADLESKINEITNQLQNFSGRLLYLLEAENVFLNSTGNSWQWAVSPYNGYIIRSESLGSNVAPFARANATSETEAMEANRAIDGNLGTRWTSEKYVLPQWLELTWNTSQTLRSVRIVFENAYATNYVIQTWNGTCWIDQITIAGNSELVKVHEFDKPVETNKLRIYVTGVSDFYRVSIWELQTYSTDLTSATTKVTIPRNGSYMLAVRTAINRTRGTLYFKINDNTYSIPCNGSTNRFEWREIGPFSLTAGETSISVGNAGLVELDEMLLYSLKDGEAALSLNELFNSSSPKVSLSYEDTNPCTYTVRVDASEPFTLVFSDTFDSLWKASVDGREISSIQAYALVNSFYINKTGQFVITLYFTGQTYVDIGLIISLISLVSSIVALALIHPRIREKLRAFKRKISMRVAKIERR
jgi:hypothetical protein